MKLWDSFNGWKSVLGYALVQVSPFIPEPTISAILYSVGQVLLPVGLAHKVIKQLNKNE